MIEVQGVKVEKSGRTVLDVDSLAIESGRLTAILGSNGAGKSTLLKAIAGLEKPDHGTVRVHGKALGEWNSRDLARSRAMLSQNYNMPFTMGVRDLVALGRFPHEASLDENKWIAAALARVELSGREEQVLSSMSGGEQQRAQLARVLVQLEGESPLPKILLLDEPTSSLDIRHQRLVLALARQLAREGYAVVAVLHDLNLAAEYADNFVLMKSGRVIESCQGIPSSSMFSIVYGLPLTRIEEAVTGRSFFVAQTEPKESSHDRNSCSPG